MYIADLHCDTILEIMKSSTCCLKQNNVHIDCEKMKTGRYVLQNFAMFTDLKETSSPFEHVNNLIDRFYFELSENDDIISAVTSYKDIENNIINNKLSALLTIEEGAVCEGKTEYLRHLYSRGVRMMTFTWNYKNCLASPNSNEGKEAIVNVEEGLTEVGFEILSEMDTLGIIADVSHLSDKGFYDIAKEGKKPFVASHSNSREICSHPRNLTDDMIKIIGERGGIIGLNYCNSFVSNTYTKGKGIEIASFIPHIKHIINKGGEACLGLGSDFDGIDNPPIEIPNASKQQSIVSLMQKNGFRDELIEKICYKNVLNFYKEVLK